MKNFSKEEKKEKYKENLHDVEAPRVYSTCCIDIRVYPTFFYGVTIILGFGGYHGNRTIITKHTLIL